MKSRITKFCEESTIAIPEEMKQFHVTEEEMEEQLDRVVHGQAKVVAGEQVALHDCVRCRCEEGSLQDRTVLLYPGLSLPSALEAEGSVVGKRVQDRISVTINGNMQVLVVEAISRSQLPTLDDALIGSLGMDQVNTVEDYRKWYRQKREGQKKEELKKQIAFYLMQSMVAQSEYEIDEEEMNAWVDDRAEMEYRQMMENGLDPHIPDEGVELLSDEEAMANIKERLCDVFRTDLVCRELCRLHEVVISDEEWLPLFEECKGYGFSEKELELCKENLISDTFTNHTYAYLMDVASANLEEETCR